MKVGYGIAKDAVKTPASEMGQYVLRHATALMLVGGIKSLSTVRYNSGIGSKMHVTAGFVDGAPKAVVAVGMIMKDAIAQILATANFGAVDLELDDNDVEKVRSNWGEWNDDGKPGETQAPNANDAGCRGKCESQKEGKDADAGVIVPEVV